MSAWSNGLAHWTEDRTAFISVVFSWRLPDAYQLAVWYAAQGYAVRAGGPAVYVKPKYLSDVAQIGGDVDALTHHNKSATIASRGCPVGCSFCIVPKMEGREFTLLPDFTPRPILCDNNLSALPGVYQDHIISRYIFAGVPLLDANSGFEPATFTDEVYHRWKAINRGPWRFAFDETKEADDVRRVADMLKDDPGYKKRVYVLIGNEPIEECYRRIMQVIEWGCEPHAQPIMALNTLVKRPQIRHDWTEDKLMDMARWANRWIWRSVPLREYAPRRNEKPLFGAQP